MKRKKYIIFYLLFAVLTIASCKSEIADTITDETVKDISGTWKVVSLTRNGESLTQRIDLSKFKVIFKSDGTYTLEDKLAFAVSDPGTYNLNDPQYPYSLILTPTGKDAEKISFQYPIIEGKRQLSLTISPGCTGNIYQYNFVKEN
ncbi:hypothetical protein PBAL39_18864 [Pedobacter sp. BAL39]|uniref:DUF5004 domain-containing protein n=1 Tax=Pedobacter sp. BAL39 TaxID=391596 RepID=UPI0001559915|nr:DUF5004 domain-containing protein [Pedobacter sp. BAL39]EDM36965.1 hypothetical protein PBAL39_18864 [Pedobacter sp. BAL39]